MQVLPKRGRLLKTIRLPCRVKPLPRPRLCSTKFGQRVFQPLGNQHEFRALVGREPELMVTSPVIVDSYAYFKPSKRLKFPATRAYGDEDNIRKAICDALQAAKIITDDALIVGGENFKLFGDDNGVVINIYEAEAA